MQDKKRIALLMMVKNEEARITVSFDSVKNLTDTFIILDTGSTDKTIEIMRDYCKKNNINFHLKEKAFVNFEVSRNDSLDFADEVCKKIGDRYLLLLDCNDELKNAELLLKFAKQYEGPASGFHLKQNWWTGVSLDSYWNMRCVKSNYGWRYKGVVHEYMANDRLSKEELDKSITKLEGPVLYQDRTKDDDKSAKRFFRDKELLYPEHLKNPDEPRTLFYLGQTCSCLGHHQEAYKYYLLRIKKGGFEEEIYHCYFRLGETSQLLQHPWEESMNWYLKAFSHSQRAEPLLKIVEYYKEYNNAGEKKPDYFTAYMYCEMACRLLFPYNQILFINKRAYDYLRWHYLGIIGYYVGKYREGKEGCLKALEVENNKIDMDNLLFYLRKDRELAGVTDVSKKQEIASKLEFKHLLTITIGTNEVSPIVEEVEKKINRQEVLNRAIAQLLDEIKNNN